MSYDIERIRKEVIDVCTKAGFVGSKYLIIELNSRLTSTLGRVKHRKSYNGAYPISIEFSKKFIDTSTDNDIHQVILHECAHAIATFRTGENHGHDNFFKEICAELGTDNDKCKYKRETPTAAPVYRYKVYCSECGELIASYKRKGKIIKNIQFYKCGLCGGKLIVKEN